MNSEQPVLIGLVTISDRATQGVYEDQGIPALQAWLDETLTTPWRAITRLALLGRERARRSVGGIRRAARARARSTGSVRRGGSPGSSGTACSAAWPGS